MKKKQKYHYKISMYRGTDLNNTFFAPAPFSPLFFLILLTGSYHSSAFVILFIVRMRTGKLSLGQDLYSIANKVGTCTSRLILEYYLRSGLFAFDSAKFVTSIKAAKFSLLGVAP